MSSFVVVLSAYQLAAWRSTSYRPASVPDLHALGESPFGCGPRFFKVALDRVELHLARHVSRAPDLASSLVAPGHYLSFCACCTACTALLAATTEPPRLTVTIPVLPSTLASAALSFAAISTSLRSGDSHTVVGRRIDTSLDASPTACISCDLRRVCGPARERPDVRDWSMSNSSRTSC